MYKYFTVNKKGYKFTQKWFREDEWLMFLIPGNKSAKDEIHILEIGAFEGRGTIWFLENILLHENSTMTCVDTWTNFTLNGKSLDSYDKPDATFKIGKQRFDENIRKSGKQQKVRVMQGYSHELLPVLISERKQFDMIFVDGNHTAPFVLADAVMSWYLLKQNGAMVFDDYGWKNRFYPKSTDETIAPKLAIDSFIRIYKNYLIDYFTDSRKVIVKR